MAAPKTRQLVLVFSGAREVLPCTPDDEKNLDMTLKKIMVTQANTDVSGVSGCQYHAILDFHFLTSYLIGYRFEDVK